MKKRILSKIVVFAAIFAALCLTACSPKTYDYSELRDGYYEYSDSDFRILAVSGKRESDFVCDGKVTPLKEYTLITLEPKAFDAAAVYSYSLSIAGVKYEGKFLLHPFASSYSVELDCAARDSEIKLRLSFDGTNKDYVLPSKTNDVLSVGQAMNIASSALKSANTEGCELYVRLVSGAGGLNWYVRYAGEEVKSVLIDAKSGEVLSVRS